MSYYYLVINAYRCAICVYLALGEASACSSISFPRLAELHRDVSFGSHSKAPILCPDTALMFDR
jgi:hypothetical protein